MKTNTDLAASPESRGELPSQEPKTVATIFDRKRFGAEATG
ncbi:MAG TPA: hypothetical protein VFP71_00135 [Candidatus Angelobacter sp.]|nr:hypothetical protein [Candidatus Angelobacter sp.]